MWTGKEDSHFTRPLYGRVCLPPLPPSAIRTHHTLTHTGEMNVDLWGEEQWKVIFERVDVVVMTAQIFLDLLVHGFLSMDQVFQPRERLDSIRDTTIRSI